ncbi:MAG: WG repeat-containing protein, partial [Clostridia bacterium]|nr:WG repeat-containing protein [Clostridia bacterium]
YFDLNAMDWRIASYTEADGLVCRFRGAYPFSGNGYACVRLENGNYGHIDTRGNLLFDDGYVTWTSKFGMETRQITQPYQFFGDYAWIEEANVLIGPDGTAALAIPEGWKPVFQWDDEMNDAKDYYVSPGGVVEIQQPVTGGYRSTLMNLNGEWLLDPKEFGNWGDWQMPECHRFFSEGLQPVYRITGIREWRTVHNAKTGDYQEPVYETKVGYINEAGETAVDFLYDTGGAFINGLALVAKGEQMGYINALGEEIFFWAY